MKPTHRNVLLLLAVASFQGVSIAQDNPIASKPPESEVRPVEPPTKPEPKRGDPESKPRGELPRPEPQGEKRRGQEPQHLMNPERGRGGHPQSDKREGDRGPRMNQDGEKHRDPGLRDGDTQREGPSDGQRPQSGPPDGQRPQSGPPDGNRGPRMNQDREQPHRGPSPRVGDRQHKGTVHDRQHYQAQRQGSPHDGQHGMKGHQGGPQNLGQQRPQPPMASPQGRGDRRGHMSPQFNGQQHPRFHSPQQGRRSMHDFSHHRDSRGQQSMRQGPSPEARNKSPQGRRHQAPMPNHEQDRRRDREA